MSLLFRSRRREEQSIATLRQRALRAQLNRAIEPLDADADANDWSLAVADVRAELDGSPPARPRAEFDPITGAVVRPAQRQKPWFEPGRQDHGVHSGRIDTGNLDRNWEGR